MSAITTHVLDTSIGRPAIGVSATLEVLRDGDWHLLGTGRTKDDGRLNSLLGDTPLEPANYRLSFDTGAYYSACARDSFFPRVQLEFAVREPCENYHLPVHLTPYGFTTYRGSEASAPRAVPNLR